LNVYWDRAVRLGTAEFYGGVLRGFSLGLALLVSLGLSGCMRKKVTVPVFPQTQVPLVTPPEPKDAQMVEVPEVEELPVPVAEAAANPRPRRRPAPKPPATTPPGAAQPQIAAVDSADEGSAIGELTTGGDAEPQIRQEAADLIASNEKRLKALPPQKVRAQRSQISKIQNFERQAQAALNSGDAEGAKTLATKAQLLLNDLDRAGAS
jgi:ribosomal protein S20